MKSRPIELELETGIALPAPATDLYMYVGRFAIVGPEVGAYRVSSRSFPNRKIVERGGTLTVTPTPAAPESDNPYISYNCLRVTGERVVLGNGSHVDPIAEKLTLGYPARDAIATALLALDYEKDEHDTPRFAGVIGSPACVGIVRQDALLVKEVHEPTFIATYEKTAPEPIDFTVDGAADAAETAYGLDYEHPVCAAGVTRADGGWTLAVENGPDN